MVTNLKMFVVRIVLESVVKPTDVLKSRLREEFQERQKRADFELNWQSNCLKSVGVSS